MADLPGHSLVITSATKLERFDKIGARGKHNFEIIFLEMAFGYLVELARSLLLKLECRIFRESTA